MNNYASFNRFELEMTQEQAEQGSHQGACDDDIAELLEVPEIKAQFDKINPDLIRAELREYGAWDDEELKDNEQNKARILWIACGDAQEYEGTEGQDRDNYTDDQDREFYTVQP